MCYIKNIAAFVSLSNFTLRAPPPPPKELRDLAIYYLKKKKKNKRYLPTLRTYF